MISLKILPILRALRIKGPWLNGILIKEACIKRMARVETTMVKSKIFQGSLKYNFFNATILIMASRVKSIIKIKFRILVTELILSSISNQMMDITIVFRMMHTMTAVSN